MNMDLLHSLEVFLHCIVLTFELQFSSDHFLYLCISQDTIPQFSLYLQPCFDSFYDQFM